MNEIDLGRLRTRTTWVFTGDSITQGVHHTHRFRSWDELDGELGLSRVRRHLIEIVQHGRGIKTVVVLHTPAPLMPDALSSRRK